MSVRSRLATFVLALVLPCAACGGDPPTKEIEQARDAIQQARTAGAAAYAGEELAAAEQALKDADVAVEQRDYRLALNHALDSREHAQAAGSQTTENKATAKAAAERAVTDASAALQSAREKLKAAEAAHAPARLVTALRKAIVDAERDLQEAGTASGRDDYSGATKLAGEALAPVTDALSELATAPPPPVRRKR